MLLLLFRLSHLSHAAPTCPIVPFSLGRDSGTPGDGCVPVLLAALDYPADGGLAAIDLAKLSPGLTSRIGTVAG